MSRNDESERRGSVEERRIFRTARLEFVPIGRVAGMEPEAAKLMQDWDLVPNGLLRLEDWTEAGLHALMLVRPLIVVGCADGAGPLHWLANSEILLAVQGQWPKDTRIPALVLAHQISERPAAPP